MTNQKNIHELINTSLRVHKGADPRILGAVSVLRPAHKIMTSLKANQKDKIFSYEDIWQMAADCSEHFIKNPDSKPQEGQQP